MGRKRQQVHRKLRADDWTDECRLALLAEAAAVYTHGVQEAFRWSAHPGDKTAESSQPIVSQCATVARAGTLTSNEVTAVFHAHNLQDSSVYQLRCALT